MRIVRWGALVLIGLILQPPSIEAHGLNSSFTDVTVTPTRVEAACLMSVEDITAHFPAATGSPAQGLELSEERIRTVLAFLATHVFLAVDGVRLDPVGGIYDAHAGGTYIRFRFGRSLNRRPAAVSLSAEPAFFERFGPLHTNVVTLTVEGRSQQGFLTVDQPRSAFSTGYRPKLAQSVAFIWCGVLHMFVRYEHLLFVVGLLIVLGGVIPLATVALAFALGHSATLLLAGLDVMSPPAHAVDGAIALTIAYVAFENFLGANLIYRRLLALGFGAVHGFGFATGLGALDVPRSELVTTVLSFNAGIEIALIAVVAALGAATTWLRAQRFGRLAVSAASGAIFLVGVAWFVHRIFDLSTST